MSNFSRSSEEMRANYERAQVFYGNEDPSKDGTHEKDRVAPTAFMTARSFAEQTNIPHAKELYEAFLAKAGFIKGENELKAIDTPHFMELRYLSSEKVIKEALEKGEIGQIIELASGFTPHSVNLLTSEPNIETYIENDFLVNSKVKQEVINEFIGGIPVKFIPGNILEGDTWERFEKHLGEKPVAIFCEGLMMYLSREQQIELFSRVKKLLKKYGGFFMHEDMLKYHPELKDDPRFSWIVPMLKSVSSNTALTESYSQEDLTRFYEEQGFKVERVPEDVPLSLERYPEQAENAKTLQQAFKMWKLSLAD